MESTHFIFNGIKSSDMDLQIMRIEHSGFIETPYISAANVHESKSKKRIKPYFYGVDRGSIEFTVQFVLVDKYGNPKKWSPQERYKIAKWLIHDTYKSFQTSDDLGKYYYVLAISNTDLNLINNEGYIEITFRCNSPYAWSPIYISEFNLSDNETSTIIELENRSNILKTYNPKIEIELVGEATEFQLKNLSNSGRIMKFEGLTKGEIISIDCENRIIKSNLIDSNPFSNFNKNMNYRYWCDLVFGVNQIEVSGTIKLYVKSHYPITQ